jgi:hypothetical protein
LESVPQLAEALGDFAHLSVTDPEAALEKVSRLVVALPEMKRALEVQLLATADTLANGTPYERAKIISKLGGMVALEVASGGAATGMVAARGAVITKRMAEVVETAGRLMPRVTDMLAKPAVVRTFSHAGEKFLQAAEKLPPGLRKDIIRAAPELRVPIVGTYSKLTAAGEGFAEGATAVVQKLQSSGSAHAADYAEKLAAGIGRPGGAKYIKSAKDLESSVDGYVKIDSKIANAPKAELSVKGYRADFEKTKYGSGPGGRVTAKDMYATHDGRLYSNARFGQHGESTLSVGVDSGAGVSGELTAKAELLSYSPGSTQKIVTAERTFDMKSVLDLTSPNVQKHLGIDIKDLIINREIDNAYELTQQLAHAARRNGFEAVLTRSNPSIGGTVLHVFAEGL